MKREKDKAEVELADTRTTVKIHCRNMTLLPTFTISRCKLMQHRTVEVTFYPEPVVSWPGKLTGTYYDYLGIPMTASISDIKAAYKKLSMTLHPDKNANNVEKATSLFKQVNEAYDCLKDEDSRWAHDFAIALQQNRPLPRRPASGGNASRPNWR